MKSLAERPWVVLKAQGIRRCCATFTTGKRCRRCVSADIGGRDANTQGSDAWCLKHEAFGRMLHRMNRAAIDALKPRGRKR